MESDTKKSSKPIKKLPPHFTADNIDNTAPVKKIIEELQHKNPKAYRFYVQNVKQRCRTKRTLVNYHFTVPGYPLNAFDKDWDGQLDLAYFEPFQYRSHPPKMITTLKNIQVKDPVTSLLLDKLEWHRISRMFTVNSKADMQKYEVLNEDVVQCPKRMVDVAAHLDSDPDPYFDSSYNWYYAGNGNLQLVCIDWLDYLLHSEITSVYLSQFCKNTLAVSPDPVARFDCGEGNYIFETIYSSQNIIVLRTKYKIFILNVTKSNDDILIDQLKCIGSELPYTSVAFDNFHKNILYVTTLDYKLSMINLDRLKARSVKLKGKLTSLCDNWSTVVGSGRGFYAHAGGNTISIYDKRSNSILHAWNDLRSITDYVSCNDISVAKHLEGTNSLYFGTDHHLFLMDIRSLPTRGPKVVQRWMHGMECVPAYMDHCNFIYNKDLICLSSQWCQDMCVVPNYVDKCIMETDSGGVTIPYRPPSIVDTLNEARQKMLCHNLYNPIDSRLYTSITGHLIMEQDEKYVILVQNSLGDITCHKLFPEYMDSFIEDDSAQNLQDWSASNILENKDFEVTLVKDISSLWRKLREVPGDFKIDSLLRKQTCKFNEEEIAGAFENEDIDVGLQEVWEEGANVNNADESSALQLQYSDEDSDKEN